LTNNVCSFYNGNLSISLEQCQAENQKASIVILRDPDVKAYQVDCLELKPRETDLV